MIFGSTIQNPTDTHMGFLSKSLKHNIFLTFTSLLLISSTSHHHHHQPNGATDGYISVVISNKGLYFIKDLLVEKAISSLIPLQVPDIEKTVKIPLVGKVYMILSNITISSVLIDSSYVEIGERNQISVVASCSTADLSMHWKYSYHNWLITISDDGGASVEVENMGVGLTVVINERNGGLELSVLDCECSVKDISIDLDGGASWLYQGLVDAFQGKIKSGIQNTILKKITEATQELSSLLESLPKRISVNSIVDMNVTFVKEPVMKDSSIEFEINGLFFKAGKVSSYDYYRKEIQPSVLYNSPNKMIEITLHENVFDSAALVYFNDGYMHWNLDEIPDKSLLNTTGWKDIIPQLYSQYPNDEVILNIFVVSPPVIKITKQGIDSTIPSYLTIDVLELGEVIHVAGISTVITALCSPEISGNNLAATVSLADFTLDLNSSIIGTFSMNPVQPVVYAILETVIFPSINIHLQRGLPLPVIRGFKLQETEILYADSTLLVYSDLGFSKYHQILSDDMKFLV